MLVWLVGGEVAGAPQGCYPPTLVRSMERGTSQSIWSAGEGELRTASRAGEKARKQFLAGTRTVDCQLQHRESVGPGP